MGKFVNKNGYFTEDELRELKSASYDEFARFIRMFNGGKLKCPPKKYCGDVDCFYCINCIKHAIELIPEEPSDKVVIKPIEEIPVIEKTKEKEEE
jgi:hypothetical protein